MAHVLYCNNEAVGDQVLESVPGGEPASPLVAVGGLFQADGDLDSASRNYVDGIAFRLLLKRDSEAACMQAIAAICNLIFRPLTDFRMKRGSQTVMTGGPSWRLVAVDNRELPIGFGGMFTDRLMVRFAGVTPLVWTP